MRHFTHPMAYQVSTLRYLQAYLLFLHGIFVRQDGSPANTCKVCVNEDRKGAVVFSHESSAAIASTTGFVRILFTMSMDFGGILNLCNLF
jgi:hypothetical protein